MINNSNIPIILERKESKTPVKQNGLNRFVRLIKTNKFTFELLGNYILRRYIHFLPVNPPTYMFCGGLKSKMNGLFWAQSKVIWGYHLDFETARTLPNELPENLNSGEFAVFLDNGTPFHPDNFTYGNSIPETSRPDIYYPSVNDLLKKIENKFSTKVVIAAHPRWRFKEMENPYEGRVIIGFSTALLVKHAKFVICHVSTSEAFAIIFRKPLIFIQSSSHHREYVLSSSEIFGKTPYVPYDDKPISDSELTINDKVYNNLLEQYLTTRQETGLSNWDIIGELVDKELNQAG